MTLWRRIISQRRIWLGHHLLVDIDANYQIIKISVQSLTLSPTARIYEVVVQLDDLQQVFRKKGKLGTLD